AGTLSGNPLAMAAGIETLEILKPRRVYQDLEKMTSYLTERIFESAEEQRIPVSINRATGMFTLFFTGGPVRDYFSAKTSDIKRFAKFFIEMLDQGIYLPPSQYEAWFISLAHTQKDLDKTIEACDTAFKKI
ncbi:MAG: aspartate aminotransferase family protein, partial [Deltaproteobacteria bacterium]|nr:aspartate aminotransferase family protein [Deltaproteobacteria bacterium]